MPQSPVIESTSSFERRSRDQRVTRTSARIASRICFSSIAVGLLLSINVYAQSASAPAASASAVPVEEGYYIMFKVQLGKNADFEKAIGELFANVRAKEPGNLYSDLFHPPGDPQTYVIMERYKTLAASKAHAESAYIKKLGAALGNSLLDGPPEVQALAFIRSK